MNRMLAGLHATPWLESPTVLIAGDSHAVRGVDPKGLANARNVGQLAQPLAITYYLIQYLFDAAPGVETVVLSFSPHNISSFGDRSLLESRWSMEHFSRYYGIVPWKELEGMPLSKIDLFSSEIRNWWIPNLHLFTDALALVSPGQAPEHPYLGGFSAREVERFETRPLSALLDLHYPVADRDDPVSETQVAYLGAILDWAEDQNVQVVLLGTPLHPEYREQIPGQIWTHFREVWSAATDRAHVRGLDLSELELSDDFFLDYNHMNSRGAATVTELLNDFLADL